MTFAIIAIAGLSVYALLKPPAAEENLTFDQEAATELDLIGQGMPKIARIHGASSDQ